MSDNTHVEVSAYAQAVVSLYIRGDMTENLNQPHQVISNTETVYMCFNKHSTEELEDFAYCCMEHVQGLLKFYGNLPLCIKQVPF